MRWRSGQVAVVAGGLLAVIALGFGIGAFLHIEDDRLADNELTESKPGGGAPTAGEPPPSAVHQPRPWYMTQGEPPALIRAPDRPILPHDDATGPAEPVRPYEETLPGAIFMPEAPSARPTARHGEATTGLKSLPSRNGPSRAVTPVPADVAPLPTDTTALPTWRRYAVAAVWPEGRPAIAIIIDDMGVDQRRSALAANLPGPLTLSYLAYAEKLHQQTAEAQRQGHELMLHLPMEPSNPKIDPGPHALLTGLSVAELEERIDWAFGRFEGYVGVNNHMGSRFTADADGMRVVARALSKHGLLFVDSRTAPDSVGSAVTRAMGIPTLDRNVFLDNDDTVAAVRQRLQEVESFARRHGSAIAIGHPRDGTLEALAAWLPTLASRGFVLVPVSSLLSGMAPSHG